MAHRSIQIERAARFLMPYSGQNKQLSEHKRMMAVSCLIEGMGLVLVMLLMQAVGQGAYGTVCSARDHLTGKKVAIKKISNCFDHDVDARSAPAASNLTARCRRLICESLNPKTSHASLNYRYARQ